MKAQEEFYQQSIRLLALFIVGSLLAIPVVLVKAMLIG